MIQDLNDQFTNEISTKQDKLDQIQAQVIETTRELASLRRQLAAENAKSAQLDSIGYKRQNLERALKLQEAEEWSDVDESDVGDVSETNPPDDAHLLTEEISSLSDDERILHLRRIRSWQSHMEEKLQSKVTGAQNLDAEKLEQYKKAMASRLKVPVEAIDEVSMKCYGCCHARLT
jgi:Ulp1 family protease